MSTTLPMADVVSEMTEAELTRLTDALWRIQTSIARREDVDAMKSFYVRRRMREELDGETITKDMRLLVEAWRKSVHYDGRD